MPEPVTSQCGQANDLIGELRQIAEGIKSLGDENERLHTRCDDLAAEAHDALTGSEMANDKLGEWREVLEDFRRGVRDRDELLERTIGRE